MSQNRDEDFDELDNDSYARLKVSGPSIALIIVSIVSLVLVGICSLFDALTVIGSFDQINPQNRQQREIVAFRLLWDICIFISNCVTLIGAYRMGQVKNYSLSKTTCILAKIPCLGPCCIIGIPFGIWGYKVLNDSDVQRAFRRNDRSSER